MTTEKATSTTDAINANSEYPEISDCKPKKLPWTAKEDKLLRKIVEQRQTDVLKPDGTYSLNATWGEIAQLIPNRSAKQCRERWCYNLSPAIKHDVWSLEEDALLMKVQTTLGNQWALIARHLKGRTENSVKTRFKSIMRGIKRAWRPHEDEVILKYQRQFGSGRWGDIAKMLPGRTANGVKARYSLLRKGFANKPPETGSPLQILFHQDIMKDIKINLDVVISDDEDEINAGECRSTDNAKAGRSHTLNDTVDDGDIIKNLHLLSKTPQRGLKRRRVDQLEDITECVQNSNNPQQAETVSSAVASSPHLQPMKPLNDKNVFSQPVLLNQADLQMLQSPVQSLINDESVPAAIRATLLAQSQQLLLYSTALQSMVSQQYQNMFQCNLMKETLSATTESLLLNVQSAISQPLTGLKEGKKDNLRA